MEIVKGNMTFDQNDRGMQEAQTKRFDERRSIAAGIIDELRIESQFVDIQVWPTKENIVEAHLYGESTSDIYFYFNVRSDQNGGKCRIDAAIKGGSYKGKLSLDIFVPQDKKFKLICAQTITSSVYFDRGVWAERIEARTKEEDIEIKARFAKASVTTTKGDVIILGDAHEDIELQADTHSGNITMMLNNVRETSYDIQSDGGVEFQGSDDEEGEYKADIYARSTRGNITIRYIS